MDKSYSILIVPRQGTRIRRLVVSRRSIRVFTFTVLTLLGLSVWMLADYFWMKLEREEMKILRAQLKQEVATLSARLKKKLAPPPPTPPRQCHSGRYSGTQTGL